MSPQTHAEIANFIWSICNLLRGPYKRNESKTMIGYEITFNRHVYRYEPPRPLEAIEAEIRGLEQEIMTLLAEVTE
jgi:hypothetical protein